MNKKAFHMGKGFEWHGAREAAINEGPSRTKDVEATIEAAGIRQEEVVAVGSALLEHLGIRTGNDIDGAVTEEELVRLRRRPEWTEVIDESSGRTFLVHETEPCEVAEGWGGYSTEELMKWSFIGEDGVIYPEVGIVLEAYSRKTKGR